METFQKDFCEKLLKVDIQTKYINELQRDRHYSENYSRQFSGLIKNENQYWMTNELHNLCDERR